MPLFSTPYSPRGTRGASSFGLSDGLLPGYGFGNSLFGLSGVPFAGLPPPPPSPKMEPVPIAKPADGFRFSDLSGVPFGGYAGVGGHFQFGHLAGTASGGVVGDTRGNIALYGTAGGGLGVAPVDGVYASTPVGVFNGYNEDFAGPFYNVSGGAADGPGANVEGFVGRSHDNKRTILGGGAAPSFGGGATSFAGKTNTWVSPSIPISALAAITPGLRQILDFPKAVDVFTRK